MTDEKSPRKLELSPAQVAGSALAAVSGAFFASWAGTTGTIIGAALGSVIATVGAATYTWSLRRTSAAVKRTTAVVRENGMYSTVVLPRLGERPAARRVSDAPGPAGARDDEEQERPPRRSLSGLPWLKVAAIAAAVLVVALGGITGFEAVTGKPVSAYTGGSTQTGTSLGSLVGVDGSSTKTSRTRHTSTPTPTPTAKATTSSTPTPTPTATPSSGATPTSTPTPMPTPSPTPTPSPSSASATP